MITPSLDIALDLRPAFILFWVESWITPICHAKIKSPNCVIRNSRSIEVLIYYDFSYGNNFYLYFCCFVTTLPQNISNWFEPRPKRYKQSEHPWYTIQMTISSFRYPTKRHVLWGSRSIATSSSTTHLECALPLLLHEHHPSVIK
jgi:hypothetical protein